MTKVMNSVIKHLDDAVIEFDMVNKVSNFIVQKEEKRIEDMVGKEIEELFPEECAKELLDLWVKAVLHSKAVEGEIRYTEDNFVKTYTTEVIHKGKTTKMFFRKNEEDIVKNTTNNRL